MIQYIKDSGYDVKLSFESLQPTSHNRNSIVRKFLANNYDYLLMIDSDIIPKRNPLELIKYDKDIIACPCPQWRDGDIYWVVMDRVEGGYKQVLAERRSGLCRVDAVGTGCILLSKKVLKDIASPFSREWDENGLQILGQDFSFSKKAIEAGYNVWAHWDYPCSHFKRIDLIDVLGLLVNDKNDRNNKEIVVENKNKVDFLEQNRRQLQEQTQKPIQTSSVVSARAPMRETNNNAKSIFIAIPTHGSIRIELAMYLLNLAHDTKYNIKIFPIIGIKPLEAARNYAVKVFLENNYDYMWFLDGDEVPSNNTLDKLIENDKDVISATVFAWRKDNNIKFPYPVALKYDDMGNYERFYGSGVCRVDAVSSACLLIKRHVLENIETPYVLHYHKDGTRALDGDFDFTQKAQKAGFEIYVDFDILCSHFKTIDLKDINNLMLSLNDVTNKDVINKDVTNKDVTNKDVITK